MPVYLYFCHINLGYSSLYYDIWHMMVDAWKLFHWLRLDLLKRIHRAKEQSHWAHGNWLWLLLVLSS